MSHGSFMDRLPAEHGIPGFLDALRYDSRGLVTVVAQDARTGKVLMVAHANREAVEKTLSTGLMHYYSRSRGKLWLKGEHSGHHQELVTLRVDCDGDALLAKVHQKHAACHLGYRSCFSFEVSRDGQVSVIGKRVFEPHDVYRGS
jgi:phosphoribosyl-AMP cyclohydrolase